MISSAWPTTSCPRSTADIPTPSPSLLSRGDGDGRLACRTREVDLPGSRTRPVTETPKRVTDRIPCHCPSGNGDFRSAFGSPRPFPSHFVSRPIDSIQSSRWMPMSRVSTGTQLTVDEPGYEFVQSCGCCIDRLGQERRNQIVPRLALLLGNGRQRGARLQIFSEFFRTEFQESGRSLQKFSAQALASMTG